jgi:ABC-type multidrug transport system ATPase subunit
VEEGRADQDKVVIRDLTRVYKKKGTGSGGRFTAVDNLTLGIKSGECFGLLGVNGAGMLCQDGVISVPS